MTEVHENEIEWVKIQIDVSYGWVGCEDSDTIEYRRSEWEGMSDEERDEAMQEHIDALIANRVSGGWTVVEDEG